MIFRRLGSATALNGSWVVGMRAMDLLYSCMGICQEGNQCSKNDQLNIELTKIKMETVIAVSIFDSIVLLGGADLINLDEVPASIVKYRRAGHSHVCGLHRKLYTQLFHPLILLLNISNLERCKRYPILNKSFFERLHSRVIGVRLKE